MSKISVELLGAQNEWNSFIFATMLKLLDQNVFTFDYIKSEHLLLNSRLFEFLVIISPLDKLINLLPGLERIDINISSHVEIVVLKVP